MAIKVKVKKLAGKSFTSLSQLESYIQSKVDQVLDATVSQVVKESVQTAVSTEVYGAGTPVWYKRRNLRNGSLGDTGEMNHKVNNGVLTVTDDALPSRPWNNGRTLAENIHYGYGDAWYSQSRPFMQEAKNILKEDKSHVEAMKDGLEEIFGVGNVIKG